MDSVLAVFLFFAEKRKATLVYYDQRERERERERAFIQEGNRAPVTKATHARDREGPIDPRVRQ